jgi:hypothetical protein
VDAGHLLEQFIRRATDAPTIEVAQGIPVGEDPNLPMDQDQFRDWVNRQRDLRDGLLKDALAPYGGSMLEMIRRNKMVRGV